MKTITIIKFWFAYVVRALIAAATCYGSVFIAHCFKCPEWGMALIALTVVITTVEIITWKWSWLKP